MDKQLRVAIDVSAVPQHPAGAGRYVLDLVSELARRSDTVLTAISRNDDGERWDRMLGHERVRSCVPRRRVGRLAWEQLSMSRMLDSTNVDLLHSPHCTMPEAARLPVVVTIHDLTFFDHPEWHERVKSVLV